MGRNGGPKTANGKKLVALNAISHGVTAQTPVIPGLEHLHDWVAHRAGVFASLTPVGHLEETLADRVAHMLWRLRRVVRYETELIASAQERVEEDLEQQRLLAPSLCRDVVAPQAARNELASARANLRLLRRFSSLSDDQQLSGLEASTVIWAIADAAGLDGYALELPGIQEDVELEEIDGWTAGRVRSCVAVLAEREGHEPATLLEIAQAQAQGAVAKGKREVERAELEVQRMRRERIIPPEKSLDKVLRYEAHLSRQLYAALHELEAMQARRAGESAPLARLEVSGISE